MTVIIYNPSPPLDAYIHCFWYSSGIAPHPRLKVLPMPLSHVMVNFGSAYRVYQAGHTTPFAHCSESWSVGMWSSYHLMDTPLDMQVLNVSFKPGGAYQFLRLPLSELHNQIVPLDTIWGAFTAEIRERLYEAPTIQSRIALMEQILLARLCDAPYGLDAVQYAATQIATRHGALSIRDLSDHIGISQKHLIARFKKMVGVTPKALARLYRFKHVLQSIDPTQPVDWTRVAYQAHYYDQSHFNKDFEAFTGHSPTEYLPLRLQIHRENTDPNRHLSRLPTG